MGVVSENSRGRANPFTLPGTEGFYLLTPDGGLGRYEAEGHFTPEPSLTSALSGTIAMLLRDYRAGSSAPLGLVTAHITDRPWRCASLVFSDHALREIYGSGGDPHSPLTDFQKKNRVKSLFQGMELVLDARKASQPQHPRYCPVFFVPEVNADVLDARYGVEGARPGRAFEVLDLMAPLAPDEQHDPVYARMVMEMVRSRIAPDLRSGPSLMLAAGASPEIKSTRPVASSSPGAGSEETPWEDAPEDRHIAFQDGDHVPYWLLAGFAPFNHLNDLQREFIARTLRISKRPARTTLIERGSMEDVSYFLVEGTVALESFDGRSISVSGGTKRAHLPVSQLNPHAYTVKSETEVILIPVSLSMLRKVTRITTTYQNRSGIEVRERSSLPDNMS
ncbi:MAG: cyclic nucleotide-binding domain-containing protein [Gammaproteobacteria bacterium]|nr:cyclic nucleotide-binding domain-containing protein [Gammaproteobacteria bacterium]